jgi:hypothetical protein
VPRIVSGEKMTQFVTLRPIGSSMSFDSSLGQIPYYDHRSRFYA